MQSLRERRPSRSSSRPLQAGDPTGKHPLNVFRRRPFTVQTYCIVVQTLINLILLAFILIRRVPTSSPPLTPSSSSVASTSSHSSTPPSANSQPRSLRSFDCLVTVYAYDRPHHLLNLLYDIAREADAANLSVAVNVIDDNSYGCQFAPLNRNIFYNPIQTPRNQYSSDSNESILVPVPLPLSLPCPGSYRFRNVERFLASRGWNLYISKYRHARRRYWHLVRQVHALLRPVRSRFFLFLPDDDRLSHNFFPNVIRRWELIKDTRKLTLMLHVEETRENVPVWTTYKPHPLGNGISRIGWVESGNFLCTSQFLSFLNWSFPAIPPRRWIDNPPISSGVGATLSELIHSSHFRMFRTDASYVAHVGITSSKMNAAFRQKGVAALRTKYFADGHDAYEGLLIEAATVTASIASHWVRESSLHSAVLSLAPQVDHINVYLNGYDSTPPFLLAPYISVVRSNEKATSLGDIGDVGKFFWCNNLSTDFHLTADDDILYPPNYVSKLLQFRREFRAPIVVGVHGIRLKQDLLSPKVSGRRAKGYYASREVWMATERVAEPVAVHIIGTGTMLYKVDEVGEIPIESTFPEPNMADIWFGLFAQRKRLPMMVIPHEEGWVKEVNGTFDDSIYKRSTKHRLSDRAQTQAALSIDEWHIHEALHPS